VLRLLQSGDAAALDEFEGLFRGARFYRGMEMVFSNTPRGALALRIDGRDVRADSADLHACMHACATASHPALPLFFALCAPAPCQGQGPHGRCQG
jgi:hypothetical protein